MGKGQSGRRQIVPESHSALDKLKYEIAEEMGLPVGKNKLSGINTEFAGELGAISNLAAGKEDYWGHITSRDTGAVGGAITSRLIKQAEKEILGL